jgi:putative transposase
MSRPECPCDNSCVESFIATVKKECICRRKYVTMDEEKRDMFRCIELFYNRRRMLSVLGYMSPVEFRLEYDGKK